MSRSLFLLLCVITTADACKPYDTVWKQWSSCSRTCGGGEQRREGHICFWHTYQSETRKCNERCMYNHPYYSDKCHCPAWRMGSCCETCRHIYIANCIGENKICGGRPDNIRCTKCRDPYYSDGYGGGCKLQNIVMNKPLNNEVLENTEIKLECRTLGIPTAAIRWFKEQWTTNITDKIEITTFANITSTTINGVISVTSTLSFSPGRDDNGAKMYCTAINNVNAAISSNKTQLHVLYPPNIQGLHEQSIEAGSSLNFSCPYEDGNPQKAVVNWTRNGDSKEWNDHILYIENVTKNDDMMYTCTVTTSMKLPGALTEFGGDSQSFHLNVLYMASITSFAFREFVNLSSATVNETDNVSFSCNVDSNPNSTIEIILRDRIIKRQNYAYSSNFDIGAASCQDAGIYTCRAWNMYNSGRYSVSELLLYVKCSPRPLKPPAANVASALGGTATFHYTGVPYPDQSFIWEKEEQNVWKRLANSSYILMTVSGVNTVLTIRNVSLESYGKYQLIVKNDIGEFIQHFHLDPEVKQDNREHGIEGVIVGGIMGGIVICVVIVIAGIFYYRKYGLTCKGSERHIPGQNNKSEQHQNDVDKNQARYVDITHVYDRIVEETDAN